MLYAGHGNKKGKGGKMGQITFNDIFKSKFIEQVSAVSLSDMVIALGLAFVLGLFIMTVYKKTFKGVMYSSGFGVALMSLSMITTLIILAVTSNIVLSLGMVGALSIVRFRAAIKEPLEIAFLFWSISIGIVLGAGLITLAVVGSIIIGLIMVLFVNKKASEIPYVLVVGCDTDESESLVLNAIQNKVKNYVIKSKSISKLGGIELTVEIRLKEVSTGFVNEISNIKNVNNVVLVNYNGDYIG